ncbi:MAG: endo-1,4-beta-xylanase, partial [Bifidobacteriaceae bacterium]|nr:endo-1,4-beta-xylanase [Bifidobacteriaceae bacterium]
MAVGLAIAPSPDPAVAAEGAITVYFDQERQDIEGFIASGAFRQADNLLNYFEPETQKEILDFVFSKDDGIGVSIWRNMAPDQPDIGDYRWDRYGFWFDGPTPTFKTAAEPTAAASTIDEDGVSNFDGDNYRWFFDSEDYPREGGAETLSSDADFAKWGFTQSPVDRGQVWAMKNAQGYSDANGDDVKFITAMWSPALWLKETDSHTYDGRVLPEQYQELAEYVADMVQGYEKVYGIPLYGFSLSNEPNHSGNYSSSYWNAGTYATMLKYLGAEFAERGMTTKLQGVEPMSYNLNIFTGGAGSGEGAGTGVFRDPEALSYLDDQAFHSYGWNRAVGGTILPESKARAQQNDQQIWLTEISLMQSQANNMATGVGWAQYWGRQLGIAEMSATGHWWAFGYKKLATGSPGGTGTVSAENLIYLVNNTAGNNATGNTGTGSFTGDYEISRTAYALGHYSKFVRPGWKRVNHVQPDFVSGNDNGNGNPTDLVTTSFINPEANEDGSHDVAIVAANGGTEHTVNFTFPGYTLTGAQQYLTDASVNVVDDPPTSADLGAPVTIAANSIYTFTGKVTKNNAYHVDAGTDIPAHTYADVMGAYTNKGLSLENPYLQTYDIPGATTATSGDTLATMTYQNLDFGAVGKNVLSLTTSNASADGAIPVKAYVGTLDPSHLITADDAAIPVSTSGTPATGQVPLTQLVTGVHDVVLVLGATESATTARVQSLSFAVQGYELSVADAPGGTVTGTEPGSIMPGESVTLTAQAAEGYQWIGWTAPALGLIGARTNPLTFTMPATEVVLTPVFRQPIGSLSAAYADSFLMGNIYAGPSDFSDATRNGLLTSHFNVMTAENYTKPNQLCSSINAAGALTCNNFGRADTFVDNAKARGMAVHGHVLVWHDQTPSSFTSGATGGTRALAKRNMETYIRTVLDHFDGDMVSWDVVNEAFDNEISMFNPATDNWRTYLRGAASGTSSGWYTAYGNGAGQGEHASDFIYDAFVFARTYAPDVKLYYNDFNLFQAGKVNAVIAMATELNAKYAAEHPEDPRQLIEGIGMQAHNYIAQTPAFAPAGQTAFGDLVAGGAPASVDSVEAGIIKLIEAGFDISASELDLFCFQNWNSQPQGADNNQSGVYRDLVDPTASQLYYRTGETYWVGKITNRAELEAIQAQRYAEYFAVYKKYATSIDRITFWGLRDSDSWRRNHNPLLWNQDYSEKLSAVAVADPEGWLGLDYIITDTSALEAAVASADVLDSAAYTSESWAPVAQALEAAQSVLASAGESTQGAINQAT